MTYEDSKHIIYSTYTYKCTLQVRHVLVFEVVFGLVGVRLSVLAHVLVHFGVRHFQIDVSTTVYYRGKLKMWRQLRRRHKLKMNT